MSVWPEIPFAKLVLILQPCPAPLQPGDTPQSSPPLEISEGHPGGAVLISDQLC